LVEQSFNSHIHPSPEVLQHSTFWRHLTDLYHHLISRGSNTWIGCVR